MRTSVDERRRQPEGRRQKAEGERQIRTTHYALRTTFLADLLLLFIGLLACWLTLLPERTQQVDVGSDSTELAYVYGTYQQERVDGRSFRWLSGDAGLVLPTGQNGPLLLTLRLHSPPNPPGGTLPMRATLANGDVLAFAIPEQQRIYHFPLPAAAAPEGTLRIALRGSTVVAPEDNRPIALALDRVAVSPLTTSSRPAPTLVAEEGLLLASLLGLTAVLRPPATFRLLLGAGLVAVVCVLNLVLRMWLATAALPFALAALLLCALTLWVQPTLARRLQNNSPQRHRGTESVKDTESARLGVSVVKNAYFDGRGTRLLWGIALAGAALRLLGVLSPGFEAHDLDVQTRQFTGVIGGLIFLTVHVHEWAGALTFYPPGPYLLLLPFLTVIPSTAIVLQAGAAILDAAGALLIALIVRQLGGSQRAALIAALLLAALPVQFTALWWGFLTNVIGQVLVLLMAWALLAYDARPTRRTLLFAAVAVSLALLSHVGVLLQAGVLLASVGIYDVRLTIFDFSNRKSSIVHRKSSLLLALVAVGVLLTLLYFSVIIFPMLVSAFTVADVRSERSPERTAAFRAYVIDIVPIALMRGTAGLPALLALPGLMLLWLRARRGLGRALLVGWTLAPILFYLVDVLFLSQVRYVYFIAPICCLGTAAALDHLWLGKAGKLVVVCGVALVVVTGVLLWLNGALLASKPSLIPLTH